MEEEQETKRLDNVVLLQDTRNDADSMTVSVLMTSGQVDEWEGVVGANEDGGSLVILDHFKDGDGSPPYRILAVYAPGMWMKAEFE